MNEKTQKYTVLFYTNYWVKAGLERVLAIILPELAKCYNVILATNASGTKEGFELPVQILHLQIDDEDKAKVPEVLLDIVKNNHVDLFVGNCNLMNYIYDVYEILLENNIKAVAVNHEYFFAPSGSFYRYDIMEAREKVFSKLEATVWLTKLSTYLGNIIYGNAVLIPNPNNFDDDTLINKDINIKTILCVGRFKDKNKRADRALMVFRRVIERVKDAKLIFVGQYDKEIKIFNNSQSINDFVERLAFPNSNSIIWEGEKSNVIPYYQKASVILVVSENEGFPMVLIEAAAKGCPGIIFEVPGLDDIINNGENGYIVPQGNIQEMADKICDLFETPELLHNMQCRAAELAKRFSKTIIIQKWQRLIETVISGDRKKLYENVRLGVFETQAKTEYINAIKYTKNKLLEVDIEKCSIRDLCKLYEGLESLTIKRLNKYLLNEANKMKIYLIKELQRLPLDNPFKVIGIYGMGNHTENLLWQYKKLDGNIEAKIVFIDTYKPTFSERFLGYEVYNINDILNSKVDEIIISSVLYEKDMLQKVKKLYGEKFKIYRFYEYSNERLF